MKYKEEILFILYYLMIFFLFLTFHIFKIDPVFGDDSYFNRCLLFEDNLLKWSLYRYSSWSSRQFIEIILIIVSYNILIWKILNSLICTFLILYTSKLLKINSIFIILSLFLIPIKTFNDAGWQATTVNYLWTLTAFIIALSILKESFNFKLNNFKIILGIICILFATNLEQIAFISIFICMYIFFKKRFYTNFYQKSFILITFLNIFYIYTCIGNKVRYLQEISRFNNYLDLTFAIKLNMGFSKALEYFLTNNIFIIFLSLLLIVLIIKKRNYFGFLLLLFYIAYKNFNNIYINEIGSYGEGLIFYITIFLIITYSLLKYNKYYASIFLIGISSKILIAFSPIFYASGERTNLFFIYSLIIISLLLLKDLYIIIKKN
jgi:hypothetical protein